MKKALLLMIVGLMGIGATVSRVQSKRSRAAKEFMRDKLELAQKVLEGVTTEDWDLVIAKGTKLAAMTKEADWRVFENPNYEQQSQTFRHQAEALVKAAKNKNLDSATLAYMRLTMSCVDCHKAVRGRIVASAAIGPADSKGGKGWFAMPGDPPRDYE